MDADLVSFFELSLEPMCIASLDGRFLRVNSAWTTRLGWTAAELTARPFLDFVHPDDREATAQQLETLGAGESVTRFENRYTHRDGTHRWLQWSARPERRRGLIFATARDVTRHNELELQVLAATDYEKQRLGRELHDGLCQSLAGIAALSSSLARTLASRSEPGPSGAAAEIARLLSAVISEAHDLSHSVFPAPVGTAGLLKPLETLARSAWDRFQVRCTVEGEDPPDGMSAETRIHLFRICQEALTNAATHGQASLVKISLVCGNGTGTLSVRDNGVGITEEKRDTGGIGLQSMASRARVIGGHLDVRSRVPQGTDVVCTFPLAEVTDMGDRSVDVADAF
ncbi:MAG: PAS domain-containing sensor histidine kinase [Gammaproteobacteria bacterium]